MTQFRSHFLSSSNATPLSLTFNSKGTSWTAAGFSASFKKARNASGVKDHRGNWKRLHDLRGTAVTNMCGDLQDEEIAEIVGWSKNDVAKMRRRYVDRKVYFEGIISRLNKNK